MQREQAQDWGYLVPRDRLERRYDKAPQPQGKVKSQEKKAKRVELGFREQCLGIWAQWNHF